MENIMFDKTTPNTPQAAKRRKHAKRGTLIGLALLAVPMSAWAYDALNVNVPLLPAVGENMAGACDPDGVTTSYTYGPTANNGVKVTGVNVASVAAGCSNGTVSFMNGTTVVASYSGNVSSGALSLTTSVWTNEFTSVRVALYP